MIHKRSVWFLLIGLCLAGGTYAQPWSGIISPSRAINWANAGVSGGIPARLTQCGSTIAAYNGSANTINTAIANCTAGQFLQLGAGTFNLNTGISFGGTNNVTVRGMGANSTFLIFTGDASCNGLGADVVMCGSNSSPGAEQNVCDWTAGYSQGTTSITLSNCGKTAPAAGSISNLSVGSILILDQVDEAADTGQIWNCATVNICANTVQGGYDRADGTTVNGVAIRSQEQGVIVQSVNTATGVVTFTPGLYMPNWRNGQKPQAFFANTYLTGDGIENLSMDHTNSGSTYGTTIMNCYQCWVKGVRSIDAARDHVLLLEASHSVVQDSYFYQSQSHATVSYTVEVNNAFDSLVQNNIMQQVTDSMPNNDGPAEGNVAAYNFAVDDVYTTAGWMQAPFYQHASGDAFNLWEGNVGAGYTADDVHGTHHFETLYRNYLRGNQNAGCGSASTDTCTAQTIPVDIYAGTRYLNVIGNVLGQASYHNYYACNATSTATCAHGNTSIYTMGYTGNGGQEYSSVASFCGQPACTSIGSFDPQVGAYLLRWGNYDTVTGAVRWCGSSSDTGWSTTCAGTSEIPSGLAAYGNAMPTLGDTGAGQSTMPTSFFYSTVPAWWGNNPWPAIGPEVAGGNLGVCSGGTYAGALATSSSQCVGGTLVTALAGHVNATPALNCYLNVMGGPPDGTGSVLNFNANTCYPSSAVVAPAPPTGLTVVVH